MLLCIPYAMVAASLACASLCLSPRVPFVCDVINHSLVSVEKFLMRSISLLQFEWHKDCADVVASFVLQLEEPALRIAEEAVKAEAAVGTQRADPADKDFHRCLLGACVCEILVCLW